VQRRLGEALQQRPGQETFAAAQLDDVAGARERRDRGADGGELRLALGHEILALVDEVGGVVFGPAH
jgi:hypothetical protein